MVATEKKTFESSQTGQTDQASLLSFDLSMWFLGITFPRFLWYFVFALGLVVAYSVNCSIESIDAAECAI